MDGEGSKEISKPLESKHPLVPYPFIRGKYGLNLFERQTPFTGRGRIETGSGRRVVAEMSQKSNSASVRIYDEDDQGYTMQAEVHGETGQANIYTKKRSGERHPDFFAKHFLAFALNHFENEGYPVKRFEARWTVNKGDVWGSDNLDEYWKLRRNGLQPEEAAKLTWTGKTLSELGFSEIETLKEGGNEVIIYFKKPG